MTGQLRCRRPMYVALSLVFASPKRIEHGGLAPSRRHRRATRRAASAEAELHARGLHQHLLLFGTIVQCFARYEFLMQIRRRSIWFVLALVSDGPNARLVGFGQSLGRYLAQITNFVSFATEEVPFPFSAWPTDHAASA